MRKNKIKIDLSYFFIQKNRVFKKISFFFGREGGAAIAFRAVSDIEEYVGGDWHAGGEGVTAAALVMELSE